MTTARPKADQIESRHLGVGRIPGGLAGFLPVGWNQDWLLSLVLVAGTILAYFPAWHAGFLWDDDIHITQNRLLWEPDGLKKIWCSPEAPQYYPLVFTSFRLQYALWGLNPAGYHWVNILLHAVSALLVWRVLRSLNLRGAWLAAAIFAVHPVNVESVAWISQRKNTLCMVFYLLSLLCCLRFDNLTAQPGSRITHYPSRPFLFSILHPPSAVLYWLSLFTFVLALLSKTAVAPLPLVLLGLAWWRRGRLTRADLWRSAPFFGVAAVLGVLTVWFERLKNSAPGVMREDGLWSQLAGAGSGVWFYLYKAVLPFHLNVVYPRWHINPSNPLSYVPGLLLAGVVLILWHYRRSWGRACLFCLGYYVAMLLPVLGFMNIGFMSYSLVADHWQYFAIIGPIALVAAAASWRFSNRGLGYMGLGGVVLVGLFLLTWRQSTRYLSAEVLWRTTLAANPSAWIAHHQLGAALHEQGRLDEAMVQYRAALEMQPNFAGAHSNLGLLLAGKGRAEEATAQFVEALRINPWNATTHYLLAGQLDQPGTVEQAMAHYQEALRLQPDFPEAANALGCIFAARAQWNDAAVCFARAARLKPDYAEAHNNLGTAEMTLGKLPEAAREFEAALRLKPDYNDAHCNLGKALYYQHRGAEAALHFAAALKANPASIEALDLLARILATSPDSKARNGSEAVMLAGRAAELTGHTNALVLDSLAAAYAEAGRFSDAVQAAEDAIQKAKAYGQTNLAVQLAERVKLYQSQRPFRE